MVSCENLKIYLILGYHAKNLFNLWLKHVPRLFSYVKKQKTLLDFRTNMEQPITMKALADLYDLLDPNKKTNLQLSTSGTPKECRVGEPLSGQRVMVPITTKAFFVGILDPNKLLRNKENEEAKVEGGGSLDCTSEYVLVNLGKNYLVDMDRQAAADFVWRKMERNLVNEKVIERTVQKPKAEADKFKIAKGFLNKKKRSGVLKKRLEPIEEQGKVKIGKDKSELMSEPDHSVHPFFEIREEFDPYGTEIRSEAIDLTKELAMLKAKVEEESLKNCNGEGIDEPDPILPSDDKYSKIVSRLEQLALEEEEYNKNRSINEKSSKKLQSKEWNKGFLQAKKSCLPQQPPNKKEYESTKSASKPSIVEQKSQPKSNNSTTNAGVVEKIDLSKSNDFRLNSCLVAQTNISKSKDTTSEPRAEGQKKLSRFASQRLAKKQF